ncbi:hypothetical protein [Bacillus sp. C30]|uniref:hypothetical protein n=1 Tax=Bacillus sp. C30 TaxID=1387733 RepID=UPI00349F23EF
MKKIKKIEAGKSFSVKVPVEADVKILDFLNRERDVSRNKLIYWILEKEAKNENRKELSIPISFSLTKDERDKLLEPTVINSLEAFVKALIGREDIQTEEKQEVDFAAISGMINYE